MIGTIYALADPETGRIRYCGKTTRTKAQRMSCHKADAYRFKRRHVCNWLRTVFDGGREPRFIVCEQIDLSGRSRPEQLIAINAAERRWIEQLKLLGFELTNATNGGDGCHGRVVSAETRRKAAASNKGKTRSAEARDNIRAAALSRPPQSYLRGDQHHAFGKAQVWADGEARSAKIRNHWQKREVREAHSTRMRGTMSAEERDKQSKRHRGNRHAARMSEESAREIKAAVGSHTSIAARFGISRSLVGLIKSGRRWSSLT